MLTKIAIKTIRGGWDSKEVHHHELLASDRINSTECIRSPTGSKTFQSVPVRPLPNGSRESRCATFLCIIGLHHSCHPSLAHTSTAVPHILSFSASFGDNKLWPSFNLVGKICSNILLLTASKFEAQILTKAATSCRSSHPSSGQISKTQRIRFISHSFKQTSV